MEKISQGKGDQELRPFSSAVNPAKVGPDNLASLRWRNTRFSGINNEVECKGEYNTPTGLNRLDKMRRCFSMLTDRTERSTLALPNEVGLTGQGVGSQEQRDVSSSSQGAREEDHGEGGPSGLGGERQVGFYVSIDGIEVNDQNIQQNEYKERIEYILRRIDSLRKCIDNNTSADKCKIIDNIQDGEKLEVSGSKEVGQNLNLSMDWGDKIPHVAENERDVDENKQYDVFISYNREDEDIAIKVAKKLKEYNIKPWLRKWEIDDVGTNLVHATDMGIKNSKSMAVIFGMHDIGKWQQDEVAAFFPRTVYKGCPIIPVYLSKDSRSRSSPFLFSRVGVNFYSESDRKFDSKKFDKSVLKIIWGINGKKYKSKINNGSKTFDVFMSYKTDDKKEAKKIANQLKQHQILPWLDDWELRPGTLAFTEMEQSFKNSKSMIVIFGNHGTGRWQDREIETFSHFFGREKSQIVLLLSKDSESKVPNEIKDMLKNCVKVDFSGDDSGKALSELIEHIPGKKNLQMKAIESGQTDNRSSYEFECGANEILLHRRVND